MHWLMKTRVHKVHYRSIHHRDENPLRGKKTVTRMVREIDHGHARLHTKVLNHMVTEVAHGVRKQRIAASGWFRYADS